MESLQSWKNVKFGSILPWKNVNNSNKIPWKSVIYDNLCLYLSDDFPNEAMKQ